MLSFSSGAFATSIKLYGDLEALAQNAAVMLFIQRAQALAHNFTLTEANAETIAEICVRLDGLPLAIELAAARIKLLSPHQLLSRLAAHRLESLTSGMLDLPVRQQTLRNTLQWSYDLLSPGEQWLFRLLSVFVGGCTVEAVEALCKRLQNDIVGVLDGLQRLLDNNLIFESKQPDGEMRLMMLETLREYGQECLISSNESEKTQHAHAEYYLALAEQEARSLPSSVCITQSSTTVTPSVSSLGLTPREMDVLYLLTQGLTSAQIADQLVIGVVTVNFHVRSIYSKLGVSSRSAATRYAIEHCLV